MGVKSSGGRAGGRNYYGRLMCVTKRHLNHMTHKESELPKCLKYLDRAVGQTEQKLVGPRLLSCAQSCIEEHPQGAAGLQLGPAGA